MMAIPTIASSTPEPRSRRRSLIGRVLPCSPVMMRPPGSECHLRPGPKRHWRSYGDHPLPTGEQALDEPLWAFPSWFLRISCERCGKERLISETY